MGITCLQMQKETQLIGTNALPTHTSWEVANTTLNYTHPDIAVRSSYYMNDWKDRTEGDGQLSLWT